jgi:hypothetical protein
MISLLRPYLATIKDSFREALASRVLWIMLILITLLLLVVASPGIRRELTWQLQGEQIFEVWQLEAADISDARALAAQLLNDARQESDSPGKHIHRQLDAKLQKQLPDVARPDPEPKTYLRLLRDLTKALNERLQEDDFFDQDAWQGIAIGKEARDWLDQEADDLTDNQLARRNRLLLEAAFPKVIRASDDPSIRIQLLFWDVTPPVPVSEEQLHLRISWLLNGFMKIFVGVVALFVAILVTASIIPNALETGSIELLLSKPVSRTLLFLSKFLGGCAFILVNAAYLIGGLWIIAGLRLGEWNHRLLLCIPIFLFLFTIYYSVSALAGVIWRSAIVSVIVTIVFWGTCFTVGLGKGIMELVVLRPNRIQRLVPAGETLVSVSDAGQAKRWDGDTVQWEDIFQSARERQAGRRPPRIGLGPVYDALKDRWIAVGANTEGGRGFGMDAALWIASPEREYQRVVGAPVPGGAEYLFWAPGGELTIVSQGGIYRLVGDAEEKRESVEWLGFQLPLGGGPFAEAGPDPELAFVSHRAVALNSATGQLAVLSRGQLTVLGLDNDGVYRRRGERQLEDANKPSVLGFGGDRILLAQDDGSVRVIGAGNLAVLEELALEGATAVRFIEASPTGKWFALVFHNGRLHLYNRAEERVVKRRISGQGDISAATFIDDDTLLVADRTTRVTSYDLVANKRLDRWSPKLNKYEWSYRYVILPFYTIYPKPGELDSTVQYLLTGQETAGDLMVSDMRQAQVKLNPWGPVWSSALFTVVVLAIACVYLWRSDL